MALLESKKRRNTREGKLRMRDPSDVRHETLSQTRKLGHFQIETKTKDH